MRLVGGRFDRPGLPVVSTAAEVMRYENVLRTFARAVYDAEIHDLCVSSRVSLLAPVAALSVIAREDLDGSLS